MLRETLIHLGESSTAKAVVTRTPLRAMARRFVPGETVDALAAALAEANGEGLGGIANFLGESEHDEANATHAADVYLEVLNRIRADGLDAYVSLKFTQLGHDIGPAFLERNLGRVLERARDNGAFVRFDMESSDYTQRTLDEFERFWADGWRGIGIVLQAYLKRTAGDVARMNRIGAPVRLCKGAYAEPASVAFQDRQAVDRSFLELARTLLGEGKHPAIATHDEHMVGGVLDFIERERISADAFEFQMLHGVRRDLQRQLVADGWKVRVYLPFGTHWYPYLMRRLAERPANVLFMAGSVVKESPLGFLWPGRGNHRGSG